MFSIEKKIIKDKKRESAVLEDEISFQVIRMQGQNVITAKNQQRSVYYSPPIFM